MTGIYRSSKFILMVLILISLGRFSYGQNERENAPKVQIALLLDVSSSMNGLLNQTKAQIWNMLNLISRLEKNDMKANVQIALGTFGNADSPENGYFKLEVPFTNDIDFLSETLYSLFAIGTNEFCGYAIECAMDSLNWSTNENEMKVIFIAGNEGFNQGTVDYRWACMCAAENGVIVNAIFCGDEYMGKELLWEDAGKRGGGKYNFINYNDSLVTNETFWDKKIFELNDQLNKTYVPYGNEGLINHARQRKQDENTLMLGNNYMRERALFKTGSTYVNSNWDLVDAVRVNSSYLEGLDKAELPINLQNKSMNEVMQYIQRKSYERETYKESIRMYGNISDEFIKVSTDQEAHPPTLENSFITIISEQAKQNGFVLK